MHAVNITNTWVDIVDEGRPLFDVWDIEWIRAI